MDRIEFLKNMLNSKLFRGLNLDHMDEIMTFAESKFYPAGEIIVKENDDADAVFWVESGRLEVQISQLQKQNQIPVNFLKAGDLFGEMALLGIEKRTATVIAKDKSQLFKWSAENCTKLFKSNREIGYHIMFNLAAMMGSRVRDMNLMLRNYAEALGPDAVKYI